MALDPKFKIKPDIAAQVIWILDNTGVYDADSNEGGWGDPNPELQESALAIYAVRVQDGDDQVVSIVSNQFIYDNAAVNNEVKEFQLAYDKDGQYDITLFIFRVSIDGTTYVDDDSAINEGEYVFYNNSLYLMAEGELVAVEDIGTLVGNELITQATCEELMTAKARILYNQKYKVYVKKRKDNCEDLDPYREALTDLYHDIIGVHYAFRTNLKSQAREGIDKIHKVYA